VLLVGDSYIFANSGLDTILAKLFDSAGDKREVRKVGAGGEDFAGYAEDLKKSGSGLQSLLATPGHDWGHVVLQDRSHVPAFCCNGAETQYYGEFTSSLAAVSELDHAAAERGAQTVLLQTWGRRDGGPFDFLQNFEMMNDLVMQGYNKYAEKITQESRKPLLARVGEAFSQIYNEAIGNSSKNEAPSPESLWGQLYDKDGSHPSLAGSYLMACVLYGTITHKSPIDLAGLSGLTDVQVAALQQTAHAVVFGNATAKRELSPIEGRYTSDDPAVKGFVGEIRSGFVLWPGGVRTPLKGNVKQFEMLFHGKHYSGSYHNSKITWSDGDVWKREVGASLLMRSEKPPQASKSTHLEPGEMRRGLQMPGMHSTE